MAKTDLKLYSTDASLKKITTTLNYVNPEANSTTLKQFAVKLNNLTTNTYGETNRVQTINVDTEEVPTTPSDIGEYSITPIEFTSSALDGGHGVLVGQITQTAVMIRGGTYVRIAKKTGTEGTLSRTNLGVSYDNSTGNIYLISTADYIRANLTLTITALFSATNYEVKKTTLDIQITAG